MKTKTICATIILVVGVITAVVWFQSGETLSVPEPAVPAAKTEQPVEKVAVAGQKPGVVRTETQSPEAATPEKKDELAVLAKMCREKYGHLLSEPQAQIAMLNKLSAYFQKKFPENWQERMAAFLSSAFPEYAATLLGAMDRLIAYNAWLTESRHQLAGMSRQEKTELKWQRRREFFGDDAEKIWEAQLKSASIYQALDDLNSGEFESYDEKIGHFVDAILNAYGEQTERFIGKRRQELLDAFLENESVQEDLTRFDSEERKAALRKLRSEMGADRDAIIRLEALDTRREDRWENGLAYMEKRNALTEKYGEEELEAKLDALRQEHFGVDADTIKGEESAGVFRFKLRRVIGKN